MTEDYSQQFDDYLNRKDSIINDKLGEDTSSQEMVDMIANSGAFDFTGEISGKSTADVVAAFGTGANASVVITDLINSRFDSSAKTILDTFTFGVSGAIQIGTYVNGVTGDVKMSPNGILARNSSGVTTFSLDGTTGNATFAGTIAASQVIAGTFTGFTFQTSSTGKRVVISASGNSLIFYDAVGQVIGIGTDAGKLFKADLNETTSTGIFISASVESTLGFYYQNSANVLNHGMKLELTGGANNTGNAIRIDHDGADGYGILLDITNGARGIYLGSSSSGDLLSLIGSGGGNCLEVLKSGTAATAVIIDQSSGANAVNILSDQAGFSNLWLDKNNSGRTLEIDQDANDASNAIGVSMNITNAGAGTEYAFEFLGSEYIASKTGVSGLTGVIKALTSDGLVYIPVYDTAT